MHRLFRLTPIFMFSLIVGPLFRLRFEGPSYNSLIGFNHP